MINFFIFIVTLFLTLYSFNITANVSKSTESDTSLGNNKITNSSYGNGVPYSIQFNTENNKFLRTPTPEKGSSTESTSPADDEIINQPYDIKNIADYFYNFLHVSIPEKDFPSETRVQELKYCNSKNLYYGIGIEADPVKARECAILELIRERKDGEPYSFSGSTILMMIYANGKGVERNLDIAIDLARWVRFCAYRERIEHLSKLKNEHWQGNNFSVCDNITSGAGSSYCAALDEELAEQKRGEELTKLSKHWSQSEKIALFKLKKAADLFIASHVSCERDLGGTGRGQFVAIEISELRDHFLNLVQDFEKNKYRSYTESDFKIADLKLNQSYTKLKKEIKDGKIDYVYQLITFDDLLTTQRLWIKYRDAWATFIKLKYPSLSENSIKTILTEQRTEMLAQIN